MNEAANPQDALADWLAGDSTPSTPVPTSAPVQNDGSDLTPARRLFASLIVKGASASDAYDAAFPGNRNRRTTVKAASNLLRDRRVASYVAFLRSQGADYSEVSTERIRHAAGLIAFADLRKAFDPKTGALLPPHQWPPEIAYAAAGYTETETLTGYKRTLKMPDRNVAIRTLAEMDGSLRGDSARAPSASFHFYLGPKPANGQANGQAKRQQTRGSAAQGTTIEGSARRLDHEP